MKSLLYCCFNSDFTVDFFEKKNNGLQIPSLFQQLKPNLNE